MTYYFLCLQPDQYRHTFVMILSYFRQLDMQVLPTMRLLIFLR